MKQQTTLEKTLWYLFLVLVVSMGLMKPAVVIFNQRLTPTDLLFPLVAFCLAATVITRSIKPKLDRTVVAILIYVGAMALSALFSQNPAISARKMAGVIYLAGIALAAYHLVDSQDRVRTVVYAFIAGSVIPVIIGLSTLIAYYIAPALAFVGEFTYHYGSVPVGNFPRLSSTFVSASMFLNYLSVAMVMFMIARSQYGLSERSFYTMLAALLICSVFTVSIGLGAVFLILGIWVWFRTSGIKPALRNIFLLGGIAAAIGFLLIAPIALQPHPAASPIFTEPVSNSLIYPSARLLVWQEALSKFVGHPATGVGIGLPSAAVAFQNTDGSMSMLTDAHNVFLSIASQTGVIGLAALIYLCLTTLRSGWGSVIPSVPPASASAWLTVGFATAFLYQGLTGSFEDARHLWLLIGLIPAAAAVEGKPE